MVKRPSRDPFAPRMQRVPRSKRGGEEVHIALCVNRLPVEWVLANGETPSGLSLFASDPLHQERTAMGALTKLADFFSILR